MSFYQTHTRHCYQKFGSALYSCSHYPFRIFLSLHSGQASHILDTQELCSIAPRLLQPLQHLRQPIVVQLGLPGAAPAFEADAVCVEVDSVGLTIEEMVGRFVVDSPPDPMSPCRLTTSTYALESW